MCFLDANADALIFTVQGEELMRFVYPGYHVGILNSNPQFALDVHGDINCSGQFRVNGTPVALVALESRIAALEAKVK